MDETVPDTGTEQSAETQSVATIEMSQNHLLVGGRRLEISDGPEILHSALLPKHIIVDGLENYRQHMQSLHSDAEIELAPFTTMHLTGHPRRILSPAGLEKKKHHEQVFNDINDARPELHPYWRAIEMAGFIPDIRVYWSGEYWIDLWAQLPEISSQTPIEILPHQLGFGETPELKDMRSTVIGAMRAFDRDILSEPLSNYQTLAEKIVEKFKNDRYVKAQIGLIVATGLLWLEAGRINKYADELEDAREYADNMNLGDIVACLDTAHAQIVDSKQRIVLPKIKRTQAQPPPES